MFILGYFNFISLVKKSILPFSSRCSRRSLPLSSSSSSASAVAAASLAAALATALATARAAARATLDTLWAVEAVLIVAVEPAVEVIVRAVPAFARLVPFELRRRALRATPLAITASGASDKEHEDNGCIFQGVSRGREQR